MDWLTLRYAAIPAVFSLFSPAVRRRENSANSGNSVGRIGVRAQGEPVPASRRGYAELLEPAIGGRE